MSPHLSVLVLMCLSAVQLCVADVIEPVQIVPKRFHQLGGWFEKTPDSEGVQDAARRAMNMFNDKHRSRKMFKLMSIASAQMQITNKINYKLVLLLGKTKCLKGENHVLDSCDLEKKRLRCEFLVTFDPRNDKHNVELHPCKSHVYTTPPPPTPSA